MEIKLWEGGLQSQEIRAIERIEKAFTAEPIKNTQLAKSGSLQDQLESIGGNPMFPWKGYAGFRFVDATGNKGEFDLIVVTHCNVLIVELKDWNNGEITSRGDKWYRSKSYMGRSPVSVTQNKVHLIRNKLEPLKHKFTNKGYVPFIDFLVVMTGNASFDGITEHEKKHTISLEEFLTYTDEEVFEERFRPRHSNQKTLNNDFHLFDRLFLENGIAPKKISVNGYKANDLIFEHPKKVYREFQAESETSKQDQALLRIWDFNQLDGIKSKTPEGRFQIASREHEVLQYIKHHDHELYKNCLRALTTVQKDDVTSVYNEIYELPPGHIRFNQFLGTYGPSLSTSDRLNLVKLLIAKFSNLHDIKVAHRDLGDHSLWLSPGKEVALSNFISAYHQPSGTVGDYRKALSVNELAVNVSPVNSGSSTPFEDDVRTLAMLAWHIFSGERMSKMSIDSLYQQVVESDNWFAAVMKNALDGGIYTSAGDLFDAIKALEPSNEVEFDFNDAELDQYRKSISHSRQYREDDEFIVETDEKEVYLSNGQIVKAWLNVSPANTALGYKVLHFLRKLEKLESISPGYLPYIREYGLATKSSSLFLVMDKAEGVEWGDLALSDDQCLEAIQELIAAIEHLHEIGIPHGDLHPSNVLVQANVDKLKLSIIDIPDFNLSDGERFNHRYSPENIDDSTAYERDNYAVMHMSKELLDKSIGDVAISFPEVVSAINEEKSDARFGFRSLARFRESLKSTNKQLDEALTVTLRGNFEDAIIYPDNGSLFVQIEKSNKNESEARVRFLGIGGFLDFIYSPDQGAFVVGFPPRIRDSVKKSDADNSQLELGFAINVKSGSSYDLSELSSTIKVNEAFHRAINLALKKAEQSTEEDSLTQELKEAFARIENQESSDEPEKLKISTEKLWQAILATETESYPYIEVFGDVSAVSGIKDELIIPYRSDVDVLGKFNKNDVIELIKINGDQEQKLGEVILKKSALNEIRVAKSRAQTRALKEGDVVFFRTRQDLASYVKRKAALERLLDRAGLIGKLVDYFDPTCNLTAEKFDVDITDEDFTHYDRTDEHGNIITLNQKQRDAFKKIIQHGPVSLLQGPPGTGKTEFIAAFVHFLLEIQGAKRILMVSQSHEAVNTAAERIRKHCARLNTPLDVVRFSNREGAVSTGLKDVYSGSLVSEKRELFRAEMKHRVASLSQAFGVQAEYLSAVVEAEVKLFSQIDRYVADLNTLSKSEKSTDDSKSIKKSLAELDVSIRETLESKYGLLLGAEKDLSEAKELVTTLLNSEYSIRPDEAQKAIALAKICRDMLGVLETDRVNYDEFLARSRQLVTGTCVGIGQRHLGVQDNQYDWVIIDEAARSISSELAIAMQSGKRILLVGDHLQLPPLYTGPHKKALARKLGIASSGGDLDGMLQSDFARAFESEYGQQTSASLLTQYRMAPEIGHLVSKVFYGGELENGNRSIPEFYRSAPEFINNIVTWVDTSNAGPRSYHLSDRGVSIYNRFEADLVIKMLKQISADHVLVENLKSVVKEGEAAIGVICMYGEQKNILRHKFNEILWGDDFRELVKIGTVDSYQGKENRIIILSITRSDKGQSPGFLRTPNRINVSLSRAMDRLVIVGSTDMWSTKNKDLPLGRVAGLMTEKGEGSGYRFVSSEVVRAVKEEES